MVNVLLTSNGISSDSLIKHLYSIVPKEIGKCSLAIIVNSTYDPYEKVRKAEKRKIRAKNIGFKEITIIDLEKDDPKILNNYDCIEIAGGNPFILLKVIRESKSENTFKDMAIAGKIIIGESAGSMILSPNLNFINYVDEKLNNEVKLSDLKALNLIQYEIIPHYDTYCESNPELKKASERYEIEFNVSLIKLKDGQAVYEENEMYVKI